MRATVLPGMLLGALLAGLAAPCAAERVEITFVHTTDLHGHILPTTDYEGRRDVGGLLRCATVIERIRRKKPNVLLLDCGDLYQGSAESYLTSGRIMIQALEWLRYDAWILGNHELDWGIGRLQALQARTTLHPLAANVGPLPGRPNPLPRIKPFLLRDVAGVRVALIGLITPGVPSWSRPELLGDSRYEDSLAALQRILPEVKAADPDLIVLATHQGYRSFGDDHANQINAIARAFPEIQFIIGGHSHQAVERAGVNRSLYTQAGYYGIWLGQLDVAYDTEARRVISAATRLHEIDQRVPFHPELEALLRPDLERARAYLAQPVGQAAAELTARADAWGQSPIQMLLCRAIAEAVDADFVLHNALSPDPLPAGPLTMREVWNVVPFENRIGVLSLTPEEIARVLEENLARQGSAHFMGALGLHYDWQRQGEGAPRAVRLRTAEGSPLHGRKRYRVAFNSYVLASAGRRFPSVRELADTPECRLRMTDVDTRGAVVDYLKRHRPLEMETLMAGARDAAP